MSKERVQLEAVEEPAVKILDNDPVSETVAAEPRFVYDVVMANMTIDKLADMGVRLIYVNNSDLFWVTSSGQLYAFNDRTHAVEAEYNWLISSVK
jgi:hypothetical protein